MVDLADSQNKTAAPPEPDAAERRPLPRWVITFASVTGLLVLWEILGRDVNPVFGSYPSAIAVAFWELLRSGQLWSASRSASSSAASARWRLRSAFSSPPATPCRWWRWCRC